MSDRTEDQPQTDYLAYACLVGTMLCWGANAVFGRLAVGEVSPMLVVLGRWVGVAILCTIFLRPIIVKDWPVLKRHLPYLFLCGALGFTGFNALFYVAAHTTTALNIGILQGAMPVFVLIGAFLVYRERITRIQSIGVLLTFAGVVTIASGGSLDRLMQLEFKPGDILMILAAFLYASYTVALRNRPKVSPLSMFAVMAGAALIVSLPVAGAEAALGQAQWPTPKGWLVVALVTIFPSFIAQIIFIQGVDRVGPGRAGVFMNLVPIFATGLAVAILDEAFEGYHAAALILVVIGIYLSEKFKRR